MASGILPNPHIMDKEIRIADCNSIDDSGIYRIISTTENSPISWGILFSLKCIDYKVQFALSVISDEIYYRRYYLNDSAWTTWVSLAIS